MEKYEKLDAEIIEFVREDVVTSSTCSEEVTNVSGGGISWGGGGNGHGR